MNKGVTTTPMTRIVIPATVTRKKYFYVESRCVGYIYAEKDQMFRTDDVLCSEIGIHELSTSAPAATRTVLRELRKKYD